MSLLLAFTFSMVLSIVLWSLGVKMLDCTLLIMLIMVIAASVHLIAPYLPGNRDRS